MLPKNQVVLQIAATVTLSFGSESSVTRDGDAVVQNVRPNPRRNRLPTNILKVLLSHCMIDPDIIIMLPIVIPHLLPSVSATKGAKGAEQMTPRDSIALMRPSLEPHGLPK